MNSPSADPPQHVSRKNVYQVRPTGGGDGFDLLSDAISTGRLHFSKEHVAVGYAALHSGSNASIIRVYDLDGNLKASHEQPAAGERSPAK